MPRGRRQFGMQKQKGNRRHEAESGRIQELEAELSEVRAAFEEYIQSSQKLEDGLDSELEEMRKWTTN